MTRFHARTAALAAAALLAGGCFDHAVPAGRDVVARTPAEAESLRDSVSFLDFHEANLSAFPEGLGAYPKLRRLSVQGQKGAAAVPASVAEAKGLVELDLIATGVKDLPPEAASLPALRRLYLSDNALAELPAAVCGMKGLDYLNLDRNALTNLPEEIGGDQAYISPEAVRRMKDPTVEVTTKADIFALGVLFHLYSCGDPPGFDRERFHYISTAVEQGAALTLNDNIPSWLRSLIRAMLDREPAQRPTADAVLRALKGESWGFWFIPATDDDL